MKRRDFIKITAAAFPGLTLTRSLFAAESRKFKSPNILLLFSDQHNANVMGCAGHPVVQTPHLDNLSRQSVQFNRAYCQDGICVPSRTSMFTGLYPRTIGVLNNPDKPPHPERLYPLNKLLQNNGYLTGCFGKRHLPKGISTGWDSSCTTINPKMDPSDENYYDWVRQRGQYESHLRDFKGCFDDPLMTHISDTLPENRTTAYVAQKTIDFFKQAKSNNQPFFCWSSFIFPHQPYTPVEQWAKLYPVKDIELPANVDEPIENLPPGMQVWRLRKETPWCCGRAAEDPDIYRRYIAYYYALVSEIDFYIGTILDELQRQGLAENTIIIYTSDHGDFVAHHGMVEKCAVFQNIYEDTLRLPLMISWPEQFKKNIKIESLTELVDLYPTLLELTGIKQPGDGYQVAGQSLVPTLKTGQPTGKSYAVSENWSQLTVIGEQYKLGLWQDPMAKYSRFDYRDKHPDMLFDRESDPLEVTNLIYNADKKNIKNNLNAYLHHWKKKISAEGKHDVVLEFLENEKSKS